MKPSIIISLLIAIIALIFAFQNNDPVTISFFTTEFVGSLALIIIASLLIGFIVGIIMFVPTVMRGQWQLRKQTKEITSLKKKVDEETILYDSQGLGSEGETRGRLEN